MVAIAKWARLVRSVLVLLGPLLLAQTAQAANLVQNGSFENTSVSATTPWVCPTTTPCIVNDWSLANDNPNGNNGQMLVYSFPGSGTLFPANYFYSGSAPVGIAGSIGATPDLRNFIFSDADYHNSSITQTINGLVPSAVYQLSFYQALAQDTEPSVTVPGPVSAYWEVHFGSAVQNSAGMTANGITNATSPWALQTMNFTASAASEVLKFVSVGTGDPPLIGLDGVNLAPVPEPSTWALMAGGLLGGAIYRRVRWRRMAV